MLAASLSFYVRQVPGEQLPDDSGTRNALGDHLTREEVCDFGDRQLGFQCAEQAGSGFELSLLLECSSPPLPLRDGLGKRRGSADQPFEERVPLFAH
jgi:hypothetical protein